MRSPGVPSSTVLAHGRPGDQPVTGLPAACYARFSSDQQDASSNDQQARKCRDAAERDGHRIPDELVYADEAVSGTRADRAGLQRLLADARIGKFRVVYFESLSRLAREFVISIPVLKDLVHNHKVRIVSVSEGIDSANAGWEMMAVFRSVQHAEFLTALRSAVLRGQEHGVLSGHSVGDWCLGYASEPVPGSEGGRRGRNAKPRMRVVVREEHAEWVRRVFRWFADEGRSAARIARGLTRLGAPKDRRATTAQWRACNVVKLLRNRKYAGVWPWGKKTNARDPLTGRVRQEDRPPAEAAKYERERPELRLVNDDLFFRA